MLRAALAYVDAGWPVVPGVTPYGPQQGRVRVSGGVGSLRAGCSCGRPYCGSPAGHPLDPDWPRHIVTTPADVRFWWGNETGQVPNIVLVCGDAFDAWSVPRAVGYRALDLLPDEIARSVPVAMTPTERWHLFTTPALPDELPNIPTGVDVEHLGAGHYVPAPPSTRGPHGHDSWLTPQLGRRLPHWPTIAAALIQAAQLAEHDRHRRRRSYPEVHAAAG
jgi:hypothetical protein